jgi:hypothetical protein
MGIEATTSRSLPLQYDPLSITRRTEFELKQLLLTGLAPSDLPRVYPGGFRQGLGIPSSVRRRRTASPRSMTPLIPAESAPALQSRRRGTAASAPITGQAREPSSRTPRRTANARTARARRPCRASRTSRSCLRSPGTCPAGASRSGQRRWAENGSVNNNQCPPAMKKIPSTMMIARTDST